MTAFEIVLWVLLALVMLVTLVLALAPLRRALLTRPIFDLYRKVLPRMSQTERDALEAGTVWWEGELFRGRPDWQRLLALPTPALTADEQAFLDGPTARVCAMVDDWRITEQDRDLPAQVWAALKQEGFFGMIIPKEYGGLGFSAFAHSEIVTRLSTGARRWPSRSWCPTHSDRPNCCCITAPMRKKTTTSPDWPAARRSPPSR